MIPPRLIPILLIDRDQRVVKTVQFGERTYIGDPFNIVRLFNEKQVDEICVLDIDASTDGRAPNFELAAALAAECFMPLSYGGGISTVEHARKLIADGVEKLVLHAHIDDALIEAIAWEFGTQCLVGCLDYQVVGGKRVTIPGQRSLEDEAVRLARAGAGELILQSIDHDGGRNGMDIEGIMQIAPKSPIPVIALGGACELANMMDAVTAGADAVASGSAFSFIGRLRAVLISYPDYSERQRALRR